MALSIMESISKALGDSSKVKKKHYIEALKTSNITDIHIWDYLYLLLLKGLVEYVVYPSRKMAGNIGMADLNNSLNISNPSLSSRVKPKYRHMR